MAVTPTCAGHPLPTKLAELVREIEIGIHYGITSVTLRYRTPRAFLACAGETTHGETSQPFHSLQRQTFVARPHFCTLRGRVARPRFRTVLGRWRSCCAMSAAGEHMRHHGATTGSIEDPWRRIYRFAAIATTVSHMVSNQKNFQITQRSVLHCVQMR